MSDDVECPYCGEWQERCHDDGQGYAEDQIHDQQCSDCEKYFAFTTSIIYYYKSTKAPCMNGGEHNWRALSTYPVEYTRMQCSYCDRKRAPTGSEMVALLKQESGE